MHSANAGTVRDDIDYQQFRDFAENKGEFTVGATNIKIKGKNGNVVETMFADGIAMPDWSAVNKDGYATLIDPQYIVSVAHNKGYQDVQFGSNDSQNPDNEKFNYQIIARNNFEGGSGATGDYHQPRLHKLVTETAPIPTVNGQHSLTTKAELDAFNQRYPLLLRIGSGDQYTHAKDGSSKKSVAHGYSFLTGGQVLELISAEELKKLFQDFYGLTEDDIKKYIQEDVFNPKFLQHVTNTSAMRNLPEFGDSGSPIFAYDTHDKQWKLLSVHQGSWGATYYETLNKDEFNQAKRQADNNNNNIENNQSGKQFDWKANGNTSTISSEGNQFDLSIYDKDATSSDYFDWSEKARLATTDREKDQALHEMALIADSQERADYNQKINHGKNLRISGEKGTLNLKSDINQGAGALYFDTDFTVKGENENITWLGAGVSVAKDKTVEWQIKNPENDRLSKIGQGTLLVNGTGENKGDISIGDGTVILNQTGGYAFNKVGIVSGRPTVKLADDKQVNPNNIYFGYRGGRLDVNGNDLTFDYIKNVDDGAMIVNHNINQTANIQIGHKIPTEKDIKIVPYGGQDKGDILLLVDNYLDTDGTFISFDRAVAIQHAFDKKIKTLESKNHAYNGYFGETDSRKTNGALNVTYKPEFTNTTFLLSGGINLNGDLTVEKGNLLLSGRPTPHAYDHLYKDSQGNQVGIEPFKDDDWISRDFTASNMIVNNGGNLTVGRNVKNLNSNIQLNGNATAQLGFINGATPVCVRSDYKGDTTCENKSYGDDVLKEIPTTNIVGNIVANDNSTMTIGNAHLTGKSTANGNTSTLTLTPKSK